MTALYHEVGIHIGSCNIIPCKEHEVGSVEKIAHISVFPKKKVLYIPGGCHKGVMDGACTI